jgi:uncharacterized protein (DUF433 family)
MRFERITVGPDKMGGVPCIRGLRIPVASVVGMVAEGLTVEEILADYPDLEAGDINEALQYAAAAVRGRKTPSPPRRLRFKLDESISPRLGDLLRAAGHDVHARDVGLMSASDPLLHAAAMQDRRVLLILEASAPAGEGSASDRAVGSTAAGVVGDGGRGRFGAVRGAPSRRPRSRCAASPAGRACRR